jgi:hypothetical protein
MQQEAIQPALLEMHHPQFKRGYDEGRMNTFRGEAAPLTDKELVERLQGLVADGLFTDGDQITSYYTIGYITGQLSCAVIPRQADECDDEERARRLVTEVYARYSKEEAQRLVEAIERLWSAQDYLACEIPVDLYERLISRDTSPPLGNR